MKNLLGTDVLYSWNSVIKKNRCSIALLGLLQVTGVKSLENQIWVALQTIDSTLPSPARFPENFRGR